MRTALKLAHFSSVPADSEIHVKGRKLRKVLVSFDVGVSELLLARKLSLPLVTIHSPCDEIGRRMIVQAIKGLDEDATVGQLVSRISMFPEFREAETRIEVRLGSPNRKAGKAVVSHACYTNGGYD